MSRVRNSPRPHIARRLREVMVVTISTSASEPEPGEFPRSGAALGFDLTMAFQPIVDLDRREVYSYEALVRGPNGEGAAHVLAQVTDANRYTFDQVCRIKALKIGKRLGLTTRIDINFMPNALSNVATCSQTTVRAARNYRFPGE